jgi:hypothetical protein
MSDLSRYSKAQLEMALKILEGTADPLHNGQDKTTD